MRLEHAYEGMMGAAMASESQGEWQLEPALVPSNKQIGENFSQPNGVRITKYL